MVYLENERLTFTGRVGWGSVGPLCAMFGFKPFLSPMHCNATDTASAQNIHFPSLPFLPSLPLLVQLLYLEDIPLILKKAL